MLPKVLKALQIIIKRTFHVSPDAKKCNFLLKLTFGVAPPCPWLVFQQSLFEAELFGATLSGHPLTSPVTHMHGHGVKMSAIPDPCPSFPKAEKYAPTHCRAWQTSCSWLPLQGKR